LGASKKYRNKTCVYCGVPGASTTADHVIAREFFPKDDRHNLPQVPACVACNNSKSALEHYILSVLPLGGRHNGADIAISDQVKPRLAKNQKLAMSIAEAQRQFVVLDAERNWHVGTITPFDVGKLEALAIFIGQGLAWHHWQIQLAPDSLADARRINSEGTKYFRGQMTGAACGGQVKATLGKDVFRYHRAYQRTNRLKTIWEMTFFGGVEIGPLSAGGESARTIFAVSSNEKNWFEHVAEFQRENVVPSNVGVWSPELPL
jgi:hypothetical protein